MYGGGLYNEEDISAKVGGVEYVCDDMVYYIATITMKAARAKVDGSDVSYDHIVGKTYAEIYADILRHIEDSYVELLRRQLTRCVTLVGDLNLYILARLRGSSALNISLPELPYIDLAAPLSCPCRAHSLVNQIVSTINKFNVNPLLARPITAPIEHVDVCDVECPDKVADGGDMAAHELAVAEYARRVELYYCKLTARLGDVIERIHSMTSGPGST
jgi:hypothetical protein